MSEKPEALRLAENLVNQWSGLPDNVGAAAKELRRQHAEIERLKAERDEAVKAEREACCKIVYGLCESDNVAQRTVDAIRALGEVPR